MVDESKLFEQVIAYLFRAKHDVKIDCYYGGKTRPRQFDGYYEEVLGDFKVELKIGIECRKRSRKVTIRDVEAFSKTLEQCGIDKGIMVSFRGFQAGAVDQAKESRIDLYEFRPCTDTDFNEGAQVVDYQPIEPGYWTVGANIEGKLEPDADFDTEIALVGTSLRRFHDIDVYDGNNVRVGRLDDMVSAMINREWLKGVREGELLIDWSSVQFFIQTTRAESMITARVLSLDIKFQLPDLQKRTRQFKPDKWHIMKNILRNNHKLISTLRVQEIEDLYRD